GADKEALKTLLTTGSADAPRADPAGGPGTPRGNSGRPFETAEVIGDAIVVAEADTISDLKDFTPAPRPELATVFTDAGDAPVKLALIPPEAARTILQTFVPKL